MPRTTHRSALRDLPCRLILAAAIAAAGAAGLSGCLPVAVGGIAAGTLSFFDRRTLGAQTDDQAIELKTVSRLQDSPTKLGGVSVTSYNRMVALTGFVADDAQRREAEAIVAKVENVRTVHNELQIGLRPSIGTATSDSGLTARIKAAFLEAHDLQSNVFKVVTESGTAYLMGLVTRREGDRAAAIASRVNGVQKVVTLFEYISEEDLGRLGKPDAGGKSEPKK